MHRKRRRPKSRRAGCLLCKRNKVGGRPRLVLGHAGFGKLPLQWHARADLR
jgi:hypothetical protein